MPQLLRQLEAARWQDERYAIQFRHQADALAAVRTDVERLRAEMQRLHVEEEELPAKRDTRMVRAQGGGADAWQAPAKVRLVAFDSKLVHRSATNFLQAQ